MNILEKIKQLKNERHWSVYRLAEESGVMQSTLSNMFIRGTMPSIATLEQLCEAFGITLSQFFEEDEKALSHEEMLFISQYKKLSTRDKEIVLAMIEIMNQNKR